MLLIQKKTLLAITGISLWTYQPLKTSQLKSEVFEISAKNL